MNCRDIVLSGGGDRCLQMKGCQEKDLFYTSQVRRNCRGLILFSMTENLLMVRTVQKWNGLPPGSLDLQSGGVYLGWIPCVERRIDAEGEKLGKKRLLRSRPDI